MAGISKTFDAKGGTDLYADYQEGYFPLVKSHTITLDIEDESKNVYTFYYVQKEAVPYTVKYLNKETGESLVDDKVVSDNRKAVVTEIFVPVQGYMPDAYQKRLIVDGNEGAVNEIIFYYSEDTAHAYYKITHYTENLDGETWTEYSSSQAVGDIGEHYTGKPINIDGFSYDYIEYKINGVTVPSDSDKINNDGCELTNAGLEINLYYVRDEYPYQVRYLEQGSGDQLAEPKNGTGLFGQVISESAIDIDGYTAVDPTSQTLNIRIEEDTEAQLNVITFYYVENEVTINYVVKGPDGCGTVTPASEILKEKTGNAHGSTATATDDQYKFIGWYKDEGCTQPVTSNEGAVSGTKFTPAKVNGKNVTATYYAKFEYNLTNLTIAKNGIMEVDHHEKKILADSEAESQSTMFLIEGPDGYSQTVTICGNDSATIEGLTVGKEYTVTEITDWSWRYTPENVSQNITLNPAKDTNILTFDNDRTKIKWLNGGAYNKNVFSAVPESSN